ncbi:hypothetical protein GCM10022286_00310 [Gryllotalpicola daejeonensis]|uniref:Uncharacterized protein n=1 Tax=Gryllotalpicola daejeonensis TaxID=993087 RepID=A0ABP7ZD18_9MICO
MPLTETELLVLTQIHIIGLRHFDGTTAELNDYVGLSVQPDIVQRLIDDHLIYRSDDDERLFRTTDAGPQALAGCQDLVDAVRSLFLLQAELWNAGARDIRVLGPNDIAHRVDDIEVRHEDDLVLDEATVARIKAIVGAE